LGKHSRQPGHDGTNPDRHAPESGTAAHADRTRSADVYDAETFDAALLAGIGSTTIGMTMTDPQGRFLWVNPAFTAISGYSASELRQLTVYDITHPDDVSRVRAEAERLLAQATPDVAAHNMTPANMTIEARYIGRNGMWLWACVNATLIRDSAGHPSRLVSIVEDMTPRVRSLRDSRRAERVSAALADAITLDDVAEVIVEHAVPALGASAGAIFQLREDGSALDLIREAGYAPQWSSEWRHIPIGAALPLAEAVRTGKPIFLESESEWESRFAEAGPLRALAGSRAWAALPLVAEGHVLGALGLSFQRRRRTATDDATRFDNDTRRFMMALAQQCAQSAERARLYQAERHARADAESANAAKSEFLAAMSHEIRTPINAIQGYAQLLELGLAGPVTEYQRTYLARLASSSHHLLGLVDDVLDLAKADAGGLRVAHELADAGLAIDTALDVTRPLAAARGVRLVDNRTNTSPVRFVGDEHRVRQILINLLTNAIKFTNAGGTVTLQFGTVAVATPAARVRGSGPWAFIRVEDTGIGIAPDDQASVFDAFHQVERGPTRTRGGTGLGLTISRRLARLLNGDVTLESAPAMGSAFTLWLPSAGVAASERPESTGERAPPAKRLAAVLSMPGLTELGALLLRENDRLLEALVGRLRADPLIPDAKRLRTAPLEDHAVTLLSDIAQTLVIIGEAGPDAAALLRDGSAIQRVIAETHGARRHAMGWGIEALRRELDIFRDVVMSIVRAHTRGTEDHPEDAAGVLIHLIDRAATISRRSWHRVAHGPGAIPTEADAPSTPDIADMAPGERDNIHPSP
jgi:PAS domain S-box-containing protein